MIQYLNWIILINSANKTIFVTVYAVNNTGKDIYLKMCVKAILDTNGN